MLAFTTLHKVARGKAKPATYRFRYKGVTVRTIGGYKKVLV